MDIQRWMRRAYDAYCRKKNWQRIVRMLAVVVVFCTTYVLMLPAITLESKTICGYTEHLHSNQCFELREPPACTLPEIQGHSHTDECWQENSVLICGLEDHGHGDDCWQNSSTLICGLEDHDHGDNCWQNSSTLVCESEEHLHENSCHEISRELVCDLEETPGHSHEEDSREPVEVLICQLEEHNHTDTCYPVEETEPKQQIHSEMDSTADLETEADWEAGLATVEMTGNWISDLVAVARSQLGYSESLRNYIYDENNVICPYTRYGQWIGQPYGDWSASFVSFCLHYAQAEGLEAEQSCEALAAAAKDAELWLDLEDYVPTSGDLIFLDRNDDGICDHVAIVEEQLSDETAKAAAAVIPMREPAAIPEETTGQTEAVTEPVTEAVTEPAPEVVYTGDAILQVISGDVKGKVDRIPISLADAAVMGFAQLPEDPEIPPGEPHVYEKEDGSLTQVQFAGDTSVPQDAELTVTEITAAEEGHAEMTRQVQELLGTEDASITLLDISFYDSEGEYLSVTDTAQVLMDLELEDPQQTTVRVFHFVDGVPVELENIHLIQTAAATMALLEEEETQPLIQTQLMFETEGFSVFAVVRIVNSYTPETNVDTTQMAGNYYIISTQNSAMMAEKNTHEDALYDALRKEAMTDPAALSAYSVWTLEHIADSNYKICSTDANGTKQYLMAGDVVYGTDYTANWGLGTLTLTTEETAATVFTSEGYNGNIRFYHNNGYVTRYITEIGSHVELEENYGFGTHTETEGNQFKLYRVSENMSTVKDLDGKSFAIVNEHGNTKVAMSAVADTEDKVGKSALDAVPVTMIQVDGSNYYSSTETVPMWTFTAVDGESGVYHISTTVDGVTKYLNMTTEFSGDLTLSGTPQELTVSQVADNNRVVIGNGYTNLNSSGSDGEGDFWCYNDTGNNSQHYLCTPAPIDSSFIIRINDQYTVTVLLRDRNGNPLFAEVRDYTLNLGEGILKFADIAPNIAEHPYELASFEENGAKFSVASIKVLPDSQFRLYAPGYDEETNPEDYYTRARDLTVTLTYKDKLLHYDLNRPTDSWYQNGWDKSNPVISVGNATSTTTASQAILEDTDGQTLYALTGKNELGKFIRHTLSEREAVRNFYYNQNSGLRNARELTADNYLAPGAEYVFLGWETTVGSTTYRFPESAPITKGEGTSFLIEDVNGTIQTIPAGTTLIGQWQQVSNAVMFFVNHGDTMLENEDNKPVTSTKSDYYTGIVAIGHLYNPVEITSSNIIYKATHDEIEAQLNPEHNTSTRLVVDAIGYNGTSFAYTAVSDYNELKLEEAAGAYIRNETGKTILLNNAQLDKSTINMDNYKLYWYVQKAVADDAYAYHIDGVLVAKTQPMEIYKTFSGLTRAEAESAISQMTFPLHLIHTTNGVDERDAYITLAANSDLAGVYKRDGWQSTTSNIYKWTLNAVQGQRYAFEEEGYQVADHDVSSLVSVHYKDEAKTVDHKFSDATYTDIGTVTSGTGTNITTTYQITDLYANKPLIGGEVESIIFANFYTATGTGAFSVSKVADEAGRVRLPGATFTLTDPNGFSTTKITNENGAVSFEDLAPGTYKLKETDAPPGYQEQPDMYWTVRVVQHTTDGKTYSVVTILPKGGTEATTLYDGSNGGMKAVYLIQNVPETTTVTVNKTFTNITDDRLAELKTKGYQIAVTDENGNAVNDANGNPIVLTLNNATAVTGVKNGYTWTINLPVHEGDDLNNFLTYKFVESNFYHSGYIDTAVTATVNGVAQEVTKTFAKGANYPSTASITMVKSGSADTVSFTNNYIDTFKLEILKVDASRANRAPIENVVFNIYGAFEFAQGPGKIDYTDANGKVHTLYQQNREPLVTDEDGKVSFDNMRLSSTTLGKEFLYVIPEVEAPSGYLKLDEPIVKTVRINDGDPNYANGVYTLTVENWTPDLAPVTVVANKRWNIPEDMDKSPITLHLYQGIAGENTVTKLQTITVDADGNAVDVVESALEEHQSVTAKDWTITWTGLRYHDNATQKLYEYYISEDPIPAHSTTYSTTVSTMNVGQTQQTLMAKAVGYEQKRSTTITNTSGYALPSTGGSGNRWYAPLGLLLILAGTAGYWLSDNKKKASGE